MATNAIHWDYARKTLIDIVFRNITECIERDPDNPLSQIPAELYSHSYSLVYTICTQKPPHNYSEKCSELICEMAKHYAMPPGNSRDRYIRYVTSVFKYLDRFYNLRLKLPPLTEVMTDIMDEHAKPDEIIMAQKHHLKKMFLRWACNEELLGLTHAEGGAAKRRERKWWDENATGKKKKTKVSE